jgi:hypothetical protein
MWSLRLTEWGIVALVLVALMWVFEHEVRVVQGQGEKVMVWTTVAALRAALTIDILTRQVRPKNQSAQERNPFQLLQTVPSNFAGELPVREVYSLPPGSWAYDPECACVGYHLLYPQWLEPAQAGDTVWFRIDISDGAVRLIPQSHYLWFGLPPV